MNSSLTVMFFIYILSLNDLNDEYFIYIHVLRIVVYIIDIFLKIFFSLLYSLFDLSMFWSSKKAFFTGQSPYIYYFIYLMYINTFDRNVPPSLYIFYTFCIYQPYDTLHKSVVLVDIEMARRCHYKSVERLINLY